VVATATARADEADAGAVSRTRAQELLDKGNELFWSGDSTEALRLFEEAHRTFPSPKLFFNIARCEENLRQRARAFQHYQDFLREAADADPSARVEAEHQVAALVTTIVSLELVGAPASSAIQIDGAPSGLTPLERPLWIEPGPHRLSVARPGRPVWIAPIDGKPGEKISLTVPAIEPGPPPSPGGPAGANGGHGPTIGTDQSGGRPSLLRRKWWLWTAIAVALAGGATTVFLLTRCPATKCE
jgi:hypothetical protein